MCVCACMYVWVFIIMWVGHMLPKFHHFDDVLLNLDSENCFASISCLSSSFLPSSLLFSIPLLTPDKDQGSKTLVFFIFFVLSYR